MNTLDSKFKKAAAMIDGATSADDVKAASLALQRLLVASDIIIDHAAGGAEVNESVENFDEAPEWWVFSLADVISRNYRCRCYVQDSDGVYDCRSLVSGDHFVFVGESQDATVAADCFRATKHAIEACLKRWCDGGSEQDGSYIGRRKGLEDSYCLGLTRSLDRSYRDQLERNEIMAQAIVVPESVERYVFRS